MPDARTETPTEAPIDGTAGAFTADLLHLVASPRRHSRSRDTADIYIAERRRRDPSLRVTELDLWALDLPALEGDTLTAKYALLGRTTHTEAERRAWEVVTDEARRFAGCRELVLSVPMWNFGIPYRLKHYIDVVTQPGLTFRWTPEHGYEGLLRGRRAVIVYASAFDYAPGTPLHPLDLQKQYMRGWLNLVGIQAIDEIDCGPTSAALPASAAAQARAGEAARRLARAR